MLDAPVTGEGSNSLGREAGELAEQPTESNFQGTSWELIW